MQSFVGAFVGRVTWSDVPPTMRDWSEWTIGVLCGDGELVRLQVKAGSIWRGLGWVAGFQCPACGGGARVLQLVGGEFGCTACAPPRTPASRYRGTAWWGRGGGRVCDALCRAALRGDVSAARAAYRTAMGSDVDALTTNMETQLVELVQLVQPEDMANG